VSEAGSLAPADVDELISSLLESVELDVSDADPPRQGAPMPGGLEQPRPRIRRRRRLLKDPGSRERAYFIIAVLVLGTGVGLLCALLLG
jgi:hypothetical protein